MPMSNFSFRMMAWMFRMRDLLSPRSRVLQEVELVPGYQVLDFGCGPGGYTIPAAAAVGDSGKVFAIDIHPLALEMVSKAAGRKGLKNVETIRSDGPTGLPDESLDVIFLFDIFHGLEKQDEVLRELARVLKPKGRLYFNDHHLSDEEIISGMTRGGVFKSAAHGERTHIFDKV